MAKTKILLNSKLVAIESEIDHEYLSNRLIKKKFASASLYILSLGEDWFFNNTFNLQKPSVSDDVILTFELVHSLNFLVRWLYTSCKPNGQVPTSYNDNDYKAAIELFDLGLNYRAFETAYTYARLGTLELDIKDIFIFPIKHISTLYEYEAYNLLIHQNKHQCPLDMEKFPIDFLTTVTIRGGSFTYKINPQIIAQTINYGKPIIDSRFVLPENWQLSNFTFGEVRKVYEFLYAISQLHFFARFHVCANGFDAFRFNTSIIVIDKYKLINRVTTYSGVIESKVKTILNYLTYGSNNINNPHLALQPLIKLNEKYYAITPTLFMAATDERNLILLLNRIPTERDIYMRLVQTKEKIMRDRIISTISNKGYRFIWGTIPSNHDLPDIDLALIDDSSKSLLFAELKWFNEPIEVRQIMEKSEELETGITGLLKLKQAYVNNYKPLFKKLNVDSSYEFGLVLISTNWIGFGNIQNAEIAIIQEDHILTKIKTIDSLKQLVNWLNKRSYLPKKGEHFDTESYTAKVGKWKLNWYIMKPLVAGEFLPT